jgi:hypothetical protein
LSDDGIPSTHEKLNFFLIIVICVFKILLQERRLGSGKYCDDNGHFEDCWGIIERQKNGALSRQPHPNDGYLRLLPKRFVVGVLTVHFAILRQVMALKNLAGRIAYLHAAGWRRILSKLCGFEIHFFLMLVGLCTVMCKYKTKDFEHLRAAFIAWGSRTRRPLAVALFTNT